MTGVIKVSTDKLRSTATAFSNTGKAIQTLTTQMTQTVNALSGETFSGEAATAYRKKFNDLQDDINRMIRMINEHVSDLNEMAAEWDRTEGANVSKAGTLSSDVII